MNIIDLIALTPAWHDRTGFTALCQRLWFERVLSTPDAFRAATSQMRVMREYAIERERPVHRHRPQQAPVNRYIVWVDYGNRMHAHDVQAWTCLDAYREIKALVKGPTLPLGRLLTSPMPLRRRAQIIAVWRYPQETDYRQREYRRRENHPLGRQRFGGR